MCHVTRPADPSRYVRDRAASQLALQTTDAPASVQEHVVEEVHARALWRCLGTFFVIFSRGVHVLQLVGLLLSQADEEAHAAAALCLGALAAGCMAAASASSAPALGLEDILSLEALSVRDLMELHATLGASSGKVRACRWCSHTCPHTLPRSCDRPLP